MRMFRTSVYMQFLDDLIAQTVVGNHTPNSQFHHSYRVVLQHIPCFGVFVAAQIPGVTEVNLLHQFFAGQFHLSSVDDDHVITGIHMRGKSRFIFTAEHFGNFCSQTAQSLVSGIHYIPLRSMVAGVAMYVFILIPPNKNSILNCIQ